MADETFQLQFDFGGSSQQAAKVSDSLEKLKDKAEEAAKSGDKVEQSLKKADKSTGDFGRSALETGRIVQDFAQGGLGGIINNLEGFTRAIGLGPGAAGAMTLLGVAALTATPAIKQLWASIVDGSNEVPKSTDKLTNLNTALAEHKKKLDDLKGQSSLTDKDLDAYNTSLAETLRLEQEISAEKKTQATLDAQRRKEQAGDAESMAIVSAAVTENGGEGKTVNDVHELLQAQSPELVKLRKELDDLQVKSNQRRLEDPGNLSGEGFYELDLKLAREKLGKAEQGVKSQARDVVAGALDGNQTSIAELVRLLPNASFGQATPEAIRAQNDEVDAVTEDGDRLKRSGQSRRAAAAAEAKRKNNLMGQAQIEDEAGRDQQKADEKQAAKAMDAVDKAVDRSHKAVENFDQFVDKREGRLADVRERAGLGIDFKEFANSRGFNPTRGDVDEAAKAIQGDMRGGSTQEQATFEAMRKLIAKVDKLTQLNNQNAMMMNGFNSEIDNLPTIMDPY